MIQTLSDLKTVRFNEQADGVIILDQTLLPGKEAYLTLTTAEEIWDAIYKLKVRGAPAIGVRPLMVSMSAPVGSIRRRNPFS